VAGVQVGVARLKLAARKAVIVEALRLATPAGVERAQDDRVAAVDLQDRRQLAGEVPVERATLERDRVSSHPRCVVDNALQEVRDLGALQPFARSACATVSSKSGVATATWWTPSPFSARKRA
jgi:hypothetical protein